MKGLVVTCAVLLALAGAAAMALSALAYIYAEGPPPLGLVLLFASVAAVAFSGAGFCFREARASSPHVLRALSVLFWAICMSAMAFALAAFVERASAHGAMEGLVVLFGGVAVAAAVGAMFCSIYAPSTPQQVQRG